MFEFYSKYSYELIYTDIQSKLFFDLTIYSLYNIFLVADSSGWYSENSVRILFTSNCNYLSVRP